MVQSMQGSPAHVIAEDFGFSESTARRRIQDARDSVRDELALHVDDGAEVPYETVTDPVLSRSQRRNSQDLWIGGSCDLLITPVLLA